MTQPSIAVIIPAYNRKEITLNSLRGLQGIHVDGICVNVVVVDDGSNDGTAASIGEEFPSVTVLEGNGSLWWSGATNLGVEYALQNNASYILTLNDDVTYEPDFLTKMLETARKNTRAIVCGLVCYENRKEIIFSAGRYRAGFLGYKTPARHSNEMVTALTEKLLESELESGYAMLIPVELFRLIGLFDARRFPHHMGDMDFVLRARKVGYPVLIDTRAHIYTNPGNNYLFNIMLEKGGFAIIRSLFQLRSNAFWRTRLNFMLRHTRPRIMAPVAFVHYVMRMEMLIFLKVLMPRSIMRTIVHHRYGNKSYENQQSK